MFSPMGFRPLFLHWGLTENGKGGEEKRTKDWKRQCQLRARLWKKWGSWSREERDVWGELKSPEGLKGII